MTTEGRRSRKQFRTEAGPKMKEEPSFILSAEGMQYCTESRACEHDSLDDFTSMNIGDIAESLQSTCSSQDGTRQAEQFTGMQMDRPLADKRPFLTRTMTSRRASSHPRRQTMSQSRRKIHSTLLAKLAVWRVKFARLRACWWILRMFTERRPSVPMTHCRAITGRDGG